MGQNSCTQSTAPYEKNLSGRDVPFEEVTTFVLEILQLVELCKTKDLDHVAHGEKSGES